MIVIVGLGNIGREYENTYHNMGFMALDNLANSLGFSFSRRRFEAKMAKGEFAGQSVILLKPITYMNLSGITVMNVIKSLKVPLNKMIIVYDDIDLPMFDLRIRKNGSAGTHNGMKDIVSRIGTRDIPRLRIGIGKNESMELKDFVLSKVNKQNREMFNETFDKATNILKQFIQFGGDIEKIK